MNNLRISAKKLGGLTAGTNCDRCLWFQLHSRLPFQFFPGVFTYLDHAIKRSVRRYFERHGRLPRWFGPFQHATGFHDLHRLSYVDPNTGIELTGELDEFLVHGGGGSIIDYKVSKRATEDQGGLSGVYKIQLNSYAYLCARTEGTPKVTSCGLIYLVPKDLDEVGALDVIDEDGLLSHFKGEAHAVSLSPDTLIPPALAKVRAIYDLRIAPAGVDGCRDCRRIDGMVALVYPDHVSQAEVHESRRLRSNPEAARSIRDQWRPRHRLRAALQNRNSSLAALADDADRLLDDILAWLDDDTWGWWG
jgi:hypothetical protein